MLDALELAEQLTATHSVDIKTAISKYESAMRKRSAEITDVTLQSMESMHCKDALDFLLGTFRHIHS